MSSSLLTFERAAFDQLLTALLALDYQLLAPTVKDQVIRYGSIESAGDLPEGVIDTQGQGSYRLEQSNTPSLFGYVVGQDSWKQFLFPTQQTLFSAQRSVSDDDVQAIRIIPFKEAPIKQAFIGVRGCEIEAIKVQDKVFAEGSYHDSVYLQRRENAFIVAVNCSTAGANCFCTSMNTGPTVNAGYDLALTEVISDGEHFFVTQVGSALGQAVISEVMHRNASEEEIAAAEKVQSATAQAVTKTLARNGVREALANRVDHPEWEAVAQRCLSCGNCTQVCPTCFCSSTRELTSLDNSETERVREWDSCFNLEHSYIAGTHIRQSTMSRYRQWLTHKFSFWQDQFETDGCTGCGHCITWCPVGIDVTEEIDIICNTDDSKSANQP